LFNCQNSWFSCIHIILQNCLSLSLAFAGLSVLSRKPTVSWVSALVHTLCLRIMAKETRKQLPFDRDAVNENLAWRIPLVLRICVQHRCSLAIRATRNRIFAVGFLLVGSNCQFGWPLGTDRHNTHAGSLYHWWIGYFILEWEKDDQPSWLKSC
jgi:hypothetical protein